MAIRVVQWTTGPVARAAVRATLAHPLLELVGAFAWSADKAGKDVGTLCNLAPLGIEATDDIEAVIALSPDVVLYMPLVWDVDHMVRLLEAGINIVATSNFITGSAYAPGEQQRLSDAAERGGASIYGTGSNPGLAGAVALAASAGASRVTYIGVHEAADCTPYQSAETWRDLGFGSPPDTPGLLEGARARQSVFKEAVEALAAAIGVKLDEVRFDLGFAVATRDVDLGYMEIGEGMVCGQKSRWQGIAAGHVLIEFSLLWRLGNALEPDWPVHDGHVIEIRGTPTIRMTLGYEHPTDPDEFNAITANPAVNAIPAVVAAAPGIVTVDRLTLVTTRRDGGGII
jgi:hypothetical protein